MTAARVSANGKWIECADCGGPLCQRTSVTLSSGAPPSRILRWHPEWRNDDPRWLYRGPRIKRGWIATLEGGRIMPWKSFGFDRPARCPACGALNALDASALGVAEVPEKA